MFCEPDLLKALIKWRTLIALGAMLQFGAVPVVFAEVIVPGLTSSQLDSELKGQVLIEELNCAACHAGDASLAARSKKAPRLSEVGSRVTPSSLEAFIRDPHGTKPGTAIPDVLTRLGTELLAKTSAPMGALEKKCSFKSFVTLMM